MVGDVAARAQAVVALAKPAVAMRRSSSSFSQRGPPECDDVLLAERHDLVEIALRDDQPAVHVEFTERERRIEGQFQLGGPVDDLDAQFRSGPVAEDLDDPVGGFDLQMAMPDQGVQKGAKQRSHGAAPDCGDPRASNATGNAEH